MHYRLYFLNIENRIANAADLGCDTDGQAIIAAQANADGRTVEIWQRTRRVEVFKPPEPAIRAAAGQRWH